MYLLGIPSMDQVERVTVSYPQIAEQDRELTDGESIELAVKLTGFLRYSLFEQPEEPDQPLITITYSLKNGDNISVSANRSVVWWKGKAHAIRDKDVFVNLTNAIFFLSETR